MSLNLNIPFEQLTKEETEHHKQTWNSGPFNFLLMRTTEKYQLQSISQRRIDIETRLNLILPSISDEILLKLYKHACVEYRFKCFKNPTHYSGFSKTESEKSFLETLQKIIKDNPKLKHLEIYPSEDSSPDFTKNCKMVIGNYVPDIIIYGLKIKGCSGITIEIDGDTHASKQGKDELKSKHLRELNMFQWEIPNSQVRDIAYITKALLSMYRLRTGSFNSQIQRAKREVWVKTIACHLSLHEIEEYCKNNFNLELNLSLEARLLINHPKCPRNIKKELIKLLGSPSHIKQGLLTTDPFQ